MSCFFVFWKLYAHSICVLCPWGTGRAWTEDVGCMAGCCSRFLNSGNYNKLRKAPHILRTFLYLEHHLNVSCKFDFECLFNNNFFSTKIIRTLSWMVPNWGRSLKLTLETTNDVFMKQVLSPVFHIN